MCYKKSNDWSQTCDQFSGLWGKKLYELQNNNCCFDLFLNIATTGGFSFVIGYSLLLLECIFLSLLWLHEKFLVLFLTRVTFCSRDGPLLLDHVELSMLGSRLNWTALGTIQCRVCSFARDNFWRQETMSLQKLQYGYPKRQYMFVYFGLEWSPGLQHASTCSLLTLLSHLSSGLNVLTRHPEAKVPCLAQSVILFCRVPFEKTIKAAECQRKVYLWVITTLDSQSAE